MSSGSGFLSGNMLVPFPFEDGQRWAGESAQIALQRCFVDACVHVKRGGTEGWPSIGLFSASGDSISFALSAAGETVRMSVSASSDEFPVVSGSEDWGSYVVTLSSDGIRRFCSFCEETGFTPPDSDSSSSSGRDGDLWMRLCARCVSVESGGLSSISVYDGIQDRDEGPHFVLSGNVAVIPGNNMTLSEPADGESGFSLDAVPGAGLGRISCGCSGRSSKKSMLDSRDGHVRIFNDTCYDLEPGPFWTVVVDGEERVSRKLVMHAKCTACCTCDMYASIVNDRLVALSRTIRAAKSDISKMHNRYESGVRRFNDRIARPTIDDVQMTLTGMPTGKHLSPKLEGTEIKGRMGRCSFTAILRNSSFSVIDATVYSLGATDSIVEATASWSDEEGNPLAITSDSASGIAGRTFRLYQGMSLVVTFIASRENMVSFIDNETYRGYISVSLRYRTPAGLTGGLGTLSRSVEV